VLFRGVDIGADLFAMTAVCVRAQMLAKQGNTEAIELADLFCREARQRVKANFDRFYGKNDTALYKVAQHVLAGDHEWLEQGIVGIMDVGGVRPADGQRPAARQTSRRPEAAERV
jgi:hypothetical protein